jgi:ubiquinone/menaquinone biosynthesis C-methylase UbiE
MKHDQTLQTWNNLATAYEEKFMDLRIYDATYDALLEHLQGKRVLDVGCGPGNIARYLLAKRPGLDLLGIDGAPNMVELARKNCPAARFEVGDARNLETLAGPFDAVICGFCVPYLTPEEVNAMIRSAAEQLGPGGLLYLSALEGDPAGSGPVTGSTGLTLFIHIHAQADLLQAFEKNGFETLHLWRIPYTEGMEHWVWLGKKTTTV